MKHSKIIKKCTIMQPTYIPWIGYFDLIDQVDFFVFYDDVQLSKRSWQVRNKVKGSNGIQWLTLPINNTNKRDDLLINEAKLDNNQNWLKKHLQTIKQNYSKTKYFDDVYSFLVDIYDNKKLLHQLNKELIIGISKEIGISTKFIESSSLIGINGSKDSRLVSICKNIDTHYYLSPQGAATYINRNNKGGEFTNNDITLYYHDYRHPVYKQLYGDFIPYLGIYDLLFNEGFDNALRIIRTGRLENIHFYMY